MKSPATVTPCECVASLDQDLASIELRKLTKVYPGRIDALRPIDVTVGSGELLVLLGPSGSGKSTILRLIAGLERPSSGTVCIDGRDMKGTPPHRRDVAMVFQNPALYPHLSVFNNLAFGARAREFPARRRGRGLTTSPECWVWIDCWDEDRARFPAVSASAWRSGGPWCVSPGSCCLTNRSRTWTHRFVRHCAKR